MPVISICNQKGGVGKTTMAVNLAQAFARESWRVVLVDLDPQGSAWAWTSIDSETIVFDIEEAPGGINAQDVRRIRRDYDFAIIDCPPQYDQVNAVAIRSADLVLVPVQPSPVDVWSTNRIVDLIRARQESTGGSPQAAYVRSRVIPNTRLAAKLNESLARQDMPTLASGTTQRVAYADSALDGRTVLDGRATVATQEIEALRDEIKELLNVY